MLNMHTSLGNQRFNNIIQGMQTSGGPGGPDSSELLNLLDTTNLNSLSVNSPTEH